MRERVADGPVEQVAAEIRDTPAALRLVPGGTLTPQALLGLQRYAGNRAALAMLAREPSVAAAKAKLGWGSTGPEVMRLQVRLNQLDEVKTELRVDGKYGPITTGAVREFQAAHAPLPQSGVATPETQAAVEAALAEDQDPLEIGRKLFALGANCYERGDFGHAYAFFTRSGELSGRPGPIFSRAQALRRLGGRREEAIALYEECLATGHGVRDAEAEAALAELRTPDATGDAAVDEATGKAIFAKGAALYERGDFAHAADEFARTAELSGRPGPIFSRAQALRHLGGRREEAIALYEEYLATGHGVRDADARAALAELRTPDATGDAATDEATGKALFAKGAAAYERGDFGHAADEFARTAELSGRPGPIFSRAQALRHLGGREDEAITLYEAYLATGHGARDEDAKLMLEILRGQGAAPD
ncbi:MAG: peptidoglycan-binding protein [Actinomycetota bacterium]|nr:peptidoglycan-binding protein [Actinomycetota bacterium]